MKIHFLLVTHITLLLNSCGASGGTKGSFSDANICRPIDNAAYDPTDIQSGRFVIPATNVQAWVKVQFSGVVNLEAGDAMWLVTEPDYSGELTVMWWYTAGNGSYMVLAGTPLYVNYPGIKTVHRLNYCAAVRWRLRSYNFFVMRACQAWWCRFWCFCRRQRLRRKPTEQQRRHRGLRFFISSWIGFCRDSWGGSRWTRGWTGCSALSVKAIKWRQSKGHAAAKRRAHDRNLIQSLIVVI